MASEPTLACHIARNQCSFVNKEKETKDEGMIWIKVFLFMQYAEIHVIFMST